MGLQTRSKKTYVTLSKGKFEVKVPKGTPGSITRLKRDKSGEVTVMQFDNLSGGIVDIRKNEVDFKGKLIVSLEVDVRDKGEEFCLQLSYWHDQAGDFLNCMENINYQARVNFGAYVKTKQNGKERTYLNVYQKDQNQESQPVPWKYTRENPGNKPDWDWVMKDGKKQPDRTAERNFYMNILNNVILPKLRLIHGQTTPQNPPPPQQQQPIQQGYQQPQPQAQTTGVPNHYAQLQGNGQGASLPPVQQYQQPQQVQQQFQNPPPQQQPPAQPQPQPQQVFQQVANQNQNLVENYDGKLNIPGAQQAPPPQASPDDLPF